jgi:hypothetical protein
VSASKFRTRPVRSSVRVEIGQFGRGAIEHREQDAVGEDLRLVSPGVRRPPAIQQPGTMIRWLRPLATVRALTGRTDAGPAAVHRGQPVTLDVEDYKKRNAALHDSARPTPQCE